MIVYALQDADGNEYEMNGTGREYTKRNSMTWRGQSIRRDLDTVENSYLPGSVEVSAPRISSGKLSFNYVINHADSDDFRNEENLLLFWLNKAVYLIDKEKDIRTSIRWDRHNVSFTEGGLLHSGSNTMNFELLTPYWEDVTPTTDTDSGTSITFNVNNAGFLDTPPDFELTASALTSSVTIVNNDNGQGIVINDLTFGTTGLTEMNVLNSEGLVYVGDLLRNNSIQSSTGFFEIPANATSEIIITTSASVTAVVSHRNRYFF